VTEVEALQGQIKNIHGWLTNAIPISVLGIDVPDSYKVEVYNAIRDWLYPKDNAHE
jgi:hypothetical protein